MMRYYTWSRREGYECSTLGDKRFSAFNAMLHDGRSIEETYQVSIKGYPSIKAGKGKPPLNKVDDLFKSYKELWDEFFVFNPELLVEIHALAGKHKHCLRDTFANSGVNQARAIATILNERVGGEPKYHYHVDGTRPVKSVFVFGSNLSGIHGKGAAKLAADRYGAVRGESEGLMDCCYAIPTVDYLDMKQGKQTPRPIEEIKESVEQFKQFAFENHQRNLNLRFFVTRIGCELAGYLDSEIAPMFRGATENCSFAQQWQAYLE